jgi:hypothetical protein
MGVDREHDGRGEQRRQQQRSRERPHRAEVEVGRLRDPAAIPFDAGRELGVYHRQQREHRREPERSRRGRPFDAGHHGRDGGDLDAEHPGERAPRQIHDRCPPTPTVLSLLCERG